MDKRKTSADWRRYFIIVINALEGDRWRDRLDLLLADAYAALDCGEMTQQDAKLVEAAAARRRQRGDDAVTRKVTVAGHATKLVAKLTAKINGASKPKTDQTVEQLKVRSERLRRRRYIASAARIPATIAQYYTTSQQAVLEIIRREADTTGICELAVGTIAARARCSKRMVQSTLRQAKDLGHLAVVYGVRVVNRISILSKAILQWNAPKAAPTEAQKIDKNEILKSQDKDANSRRSKRVNPIGSPPEAVRRPGDTEVVKTSNARPGPTSSKSEPTMAQVQGDRRFRQWVDEHFGRTGISLHAKFGFEPPKGVPQPG